MMRGPERWSRDQRAVGTQARRGGMHARHHQRLFRRQCREQAGQPLGQHGLPRARRAYHQHVVPARGGHLECMAAKSLTPDVGQRGFPCVAQRHHETARCRRVGEGDHARDMAE